MTYDKLKPVVIAYAKEAGLAPSTVMARATGNARLFRRWDNHIARMEKATKQLVDYMENNPVGDKK